MKTQNGRSGLATLELTMALPILTLIFVGVLVIANASNRRNDDFLRSRNQAMHRHTKAQINEVDSRKSKKLTRNQSKLVPYSRDMFLPTEDWVIETSQELTFSSEAYTEQNKTTRLPSLIFAGTGSPENRSAGQIDPPNEKVDELTLSPMAKSLGRQMGIRTADLRSLISSLVSIKENGSVDMTGLGFLANTNANQATDQIKEQIKDLVEQQSNTSNPLKIKKLAKEIEKLQDRIESIRSQLSQANSMAQKFTQEVADFPPDLKSGLGLSSYIDQIRN